MKRRLSTDDTPILISWWEISDIFASVAVYLTPFDLCHAFLVCKRWKSYDCEYFWEGYYETNFNNACDRRIQNAAQKLYETPLRFPEQGEDWMSYHELFWVSCPLFPGVNAAQVKTWNNLFGFDIDVRKTA